MPVPIPVHNHLACLFRSVREDVLTLSFFRLFLTSLKTYAPKNRLHFPYSIAPLLGVPFPLLLTFSIFLHHEKISHLQYFVAFSTVYNYVHQRYYSISLAILAPFLLPTPHTSASQCFVFNPLLAYFRSNISSTAVSSTSIYSLMNSTYLILIHLPHASQPSVQL